MKNIIMLTLKYIHKLIKLFKNTEHVLKLNLNIKSDLSIDLSNRSLQDHFFIFSQAKVMFVANIYSK